MYQCWLLIRWFYFTLVSSLFFVHASIRLIINALIIDKRSNQATNQSASQPASQPVSHPSIHSMYRTTCTQWQRHYIYHSNSVWSWYFMIIDEWIWVCLFVFVMIAQRSLTIQELRMPTIQISLLITQKKKIEYS